MRSKGRRGRQAEWPLSLLLLAHMGKPAFMNWLVFPFLFLTEKNSFAEEKATRWPLQSKLPMLLAPRSLFKNIISLLSSSPSHD